jgi:hypothetical protein
MLLGSFFIKEAQLLGRQFSTTRRVAMPLALSFAAVLLGCGNERTTAPQSASTSTPALSVLGRPGTPVSLDEQFAAVADRAPGFAGMYYDADGVLVVRRTVAASLST